MDKIEDERVRFYIENEQLIRTWAALQGQVFETAREFLTDLCSELEAAPPEFGTAVQPFVRLDVDSPHILFHEPDWPLTQSGRPLVAVGLEWWHRKVDFGPRHRPYIGVRVDRTDPRGPDLVSRLRERVEEQRKAHGYERLSPATWWPAYRTESAQGAYVDDLGLYRDQLVGALVHTWNLFRDDVVAELEDLPRD